MNTLDKTFSIGRINHKVDQLIHDRTFNACQIESADDIHLTGKPEFSLFIPRGIRKAVTDGERFDIWTSWVIIVGYAIPSFLFAIFLIVFLAGGSFLQIFPLRGLASDNWATFSWPHKISDYFWHITLPVFANVISGFASLTLLTKNSFLEEINKQYVLTARAKGLSERRVLYGHVFRNAMLIVVSGFPAAFIHK